MANKVSEQVERNKPLITPPQKKPLPGKPQRPVMPEKGKPSKPRLDDALHLLDKVACLIVVGILIALSSCSSSSNKAKSIDYEAMSKEELTQLDSQGDCMASLQLGRVIWKEHKFNDAVKYFQKATTSDNKEIRKVALYNFGMSQTQKGDSIMHIIKESADLGYAPAQGVYAANMIKNGNLKIGYEYAQKSIAQNDGNGYYAMALYYSTLTSDPLLIADKELPRDNDLLNEENGVLGNLKKSAELGSVEGFYALVNILHNSHTSKQEILNTISQYKNNYPQLAQDLIAITNGDSSIQSTERWEQGWDLLDYIIK